MIACGATNWLYKSRSRLSSIPFSFCIRGLLVWKMTFFLSNAMMLWLILGLSAMTSELFPVLFYLLLSCLSCFFFSSTFCFFISSHFTRNHTGKTGSFSLEHCWACCLANNFPSLLLFARCIRSVPHLSFFPSSTAWRCRSTVLWLWCLKLNLGGREIIDYHMRKKQDYWHSLQLKRYTTFEILADD